MKNTTHDSTDSSANLSPSDFLDRMVLRFIDGYDVLRPIRPQKDTGVKRIIRIPIVIFMIIDLTAVVGLVWNFVANHSLATAFDVSHYYCHVVAASANAYFIVKYRKEVIELSLDVNRWFLYRGMEEESMSYKVKATGISERIIPRLSQLVTICSFSYLLLPVLKLLLAEDRSDMTNFLVVPCHYGLPLKEWWGYLLTYSIGAMVSSFSYIICFNVMYFYITSYIYLYCGLELFQKAIVSVSERSDTIWRREPDVGYEVVLNQEIRSCAIHLLKLRSFKEKADRICSILGSAYYYGGLWALCTSGYLITTTNETSLKIKFLVMLFSELLAMYVFTYVNEILLKEFENARQAVYSSDWYNMPKSSALRMKIINWMCLRPPQMKTVIGFTVSIENFGAIVNASYSYFNVLSAADRK